MRHELREIAAQAPLQTLTLHGDRVADWLTGAHYDLREDRWDRRHPGTMYRFDSATSFEDHAVVYETGGTKGVLLRDNGVEPSENFVPMGATWVRELDRSFYQAQSFDFPVRIFRLFDGRRILAHCPSSYDRLELDVLETGERLTARTCESEDIFHSRLCASPDGRWLSSNGWVWHPYGVACLYDLERALREPAYLSTTGQALPFGDAWDGEHHAAAFVGSRYVVSTDEGAPKWALFTLDAETRCERVVPLEEPAGTILMAWGDAHVVALEGVPRVFDLHTGRVVHRWEGLRGGLPRGQPRVALVTEGEVQVATDPAGGRFALCDGIRLTVVTCSE